MKDGEGEGGRNTKQYKERERWRMSGREEKHEKGKQRKQRREREKAGGGEKSIRRVAMPRWGHADCTGEPGSPSERR